MRILVDTNILLRAIQRSGSLSQSARRALKTLHQQGYELCVTPQNVREFWNVCTRPTDNNGMGLSVAAAERHARTLEKYFVVLSDSGATYEQWRSLVATYGIIGKQVHDTYIAAAMKTHGVTRILTFDARDFARFTESRSSIRYLSSVPF